MLLIAANLAVHLAGKVGSTAGWFTLEEFIDWGGLDPQHFTLRQAFTSQFFHDPGGPWHIGFNMLFLWVFGIAVESRLGRVGFLVFYLLGGLASALGHCLVSDAPVIGASGAVSAVVGAFLALFPRSHIMVLFLLTMAVYSVPSVWFIGLYFLIDLLNQVTEVFAGASARVAYMAHLAGYAYGFGVGFALLGLKILKREEFDIFYLFKQARRRAAFRAANKDTAAGMWDAPQSDTSERLTRAAAKAEPLSEDQRRIAELRAEVHRLVSVPDLAAAAARYLELMAQSPGSVLQEQPQLDVGNQLYANGDLEHAARAYELFLRHYPRKSRSDEVRLILGLCYARRLNQPQRARELLAQAQARLIEPAHAALAAQLLSELGP